MRSLAVAVWLAAVLSPRSIAFAQAGVAAPPVGPPRTWSYSATATMNVLPGEDDLVQPTLRADRAALHLEGRYQYEDRESVSGFAGWNHVAAGKLTLALTPMLGAVVGRTDGAIPALELTLGFERLELYSESEYVIALGGAGDDFFYNWSELDVSLTDWLSGGLVTQRSRTVETSRDLQRGPFVRLTRGPVDGTAYFFNPGSDDHYFVGSIGVSF